MLGRGGMGEVLLAEDTLLRRRVALKRVRAGGAQDAIERRTAVLKEARRASQVNDRRIAAIHDVLDLGDEVLIVMEYVEGETLRQRLREPLPLEQFWDLSRQCLEALGAAHEHGVIHRDIKPENLMVTRGQEIKILDFGIASRSPRGAGVADEGGTTVTRELYPGAAGTPPYMAPEAHYGGRVDERTDIFSLGAVFYEMLTARHPFAADTPERVLDRIMNDAPRPPSELNPAVTPELSGVIARMLARDPARRFATCADVRAALREAKRASGAVLTADPTVAVSARPGRVGATRTKLAWTVFGFAVVAVAAVAWRLFAMPRLPAERRLAVLPPRTPGASGDLAAYAFGTTEMLSQRLLRLQIQPGFQMSTFAESVDEKLASAADGRRALGANVVLRPTIEQQDNQLRAELELLEPVRERVIARRTVGAPVAEPFAFADSVYHAALAMLRLPVPARTAQEDLGIRGSGTLRFLMQGIGRRRTATTPEERLRALGDIETAYRTEPDPAAPRAWLANAQISLFYATQDTSWLVRAEASGREAVGIDSTLPEAQLALAAALGARKRWAESLLHYRTATRLDPASDEAWYRWGRTCLRLGSADEERRVYEAAIARRPHCFKPRWWLASWSYRNGHVDEAIQGFRDMVRRSPTLFTGYANLGGLLLFRGEYGPAIDTLRLAVELRPDATAFNNLGTAYFNSGQLSKAVDAYNQAFQFDDAGYETWMNLGDAYYWLRNRPDQARDAYRQAIRLGNVVMADRVRRGSSPDAMVPAHLAIVFARLGERDSAQAMLRMALAVDSASSRVQYEVALTRWELGDHAAGMDWLRRSVAGGFPIPWLRDSPVHRDWRGDPGFAVLLTGPTPVGSSSVGNGGR